MQEPGLCVWVSLASRGLHYGISLTVVIEREVEPVSAMTGDVDLVSDHPRDALQVVGVPVHARRSAVEVESHDISEHGLGERWPPHRTARSRREFDERADIDPCGALFGGRICRAAGGWRGRGRGRGRLFGARARRL